MRIHFRLCLVILLLTFLPACAGIHPATAVQVEEVVRMTMTAAPTPTVALTPELPTGPACSVADDCVLAYRTDHCCPCASIYNRQEVERNRRLRYVDEPEGYRYKRWRTPRKLCLMMMCAPCPMRPFGLVCDSGTCRGAETWQEIWSACTRLESQQTLWCHVNAAITAYQNAGEDQAVTVCNSLEGDEAPGVTFAQECLLEVARPLMVNEPRAAADFCRRHLDALRSNCLHETAYTIGRADVETALALCSEIEILSGNDATQKDFCFHNVAMSVAKVDLEQARQICERMARDVEQCKLDAENPQGVP